MRGDSRVCVGMIGIRPYVFIPVSEQGDVVCPPVVVPPGAWYLPGCGGEDAPCPLVMAGWALETKEVTSPLERSHPCRRGHVPAAA